KLWVLNLIIESGSLKQAALQAKVSPSAISQSLSSLEQSFGRPLLIRERGLVEPTQEALAILDVVRPAFDAFDRLKDINQSPIPQMTWLNFGTYESMAIDFVPGLINSLRTRLPLLKLGLRISRTGNLLTMVRKGELCSAMIGEIDEIERFYHKEVYRDRLGLFVSKRHPIADLGWKALEQYSLGSLTPGKDGLPRYFSKFLRQLESNKPTILSDSFEALRASAAAGVIVAVLPLKVASRNDDLLEIFPPKSKAFKEDGSHGIFVVSQINCDHDEVDFLATEARRVLQIRTT
ncbi:MAG: LysR family transcriptional regulator, partial [Proteobacteria bacterium]